MRKKDVAGIICLSSCAAHFLHITMILSNRTTGIEDHVREQISRYFTTALVGISRLSLLSPPSLKNLQALVYGVRFNVNLD